MNRKRRATFQCAAFFYIGVYDLFTVLWHPEVGLGRLKLKGTEDGSFKFRNSRRGADAKPATTTARATGRTCEH